MADGSSLGVAADSASRSLLCVAPTPHCYPEAVTVPDSDPRRPGPADSCPSLVAKAFPPGVVLWVKLCCSKRYIEVLTPSALECGSIWQ